MVGFRGKPARGQREEIYGQAAHQERGDMHTMLPARVVDFDPETQTATIEVLHVPRLNGQEAPIPQLKQVPVAMSRAGGFAVTYPIQVGDGGMMQFAGRSLDAWYESGEAKPADSARMHDLSDGIFIPGGMVAKPQALSSYNSENAEVRTLDGNYKIEMSPDGKIAIVGKEGELYDLMSQVCEQIEKLCTAVAEIAFKLKSEPNIVQNYTPDQTTANEVDVYVNGIRDKLDGMKIE